MGWNIVHLEEMTTLKFSHACAMAINDALENGDHSGAECEELDDGQWQLGFFDDHMEHMDYLWDDEIQKILADFKVNGRVCFMSAEGDNAGDYWGHDFKDGVHTEIFGERTVHWSTEPPKPKKKKRRR
jgi:hypothetical protein